MKELAALAARHGFEIACREDGNPVLKPLREDAVLPGRVKYTFQCNRQVVVEWYRRTHRTADEKCRKCLAIVTPVWEGQCESVLCPEVLCPYKDG